MVNKKSDVKYKSQILQSHPVLKTENRLVTMEISHLDDFKLEQQLYELDENDEDISYEG